MYVYVLRAPRVCTPDCISARDACHLGSTANGAAAYAEGPTSTENMPPNPALLRERRPSPCFVGGPTAWQQRLSAFIQCAHEGLLLFLVFSYLLPHACAPPVSAVVSAGALCAMP